jgi:hypothetical protein
LSPELAEEALPGYTLPAMQAARCEHRAKPIDLEETRMTDELELRVALEKAVWSVIKLAKSRRIDRALPRFDYSVSWWQPGREGGAVGKTEDRSEPSFQLLQQQLGKDFTEDRSVSDLNHAASQLSRKYEQNVSVRSRLQNGGGYFLLSIYFDKVGSLRFNRHLIETICSECEADLKMSKVIKVSIYRVQDFHANHSFVLDEGIKFHAVRDEDVDQYCRHDRGDFRSRIRLSLADWICRIETCEPKTEAVKAFIPANGIVDQIAGALNLTVDGRSRFSLLERHYKSIAFSGMRGSGGHELLTSGVKGPLGLDSTELKKFRSLFQAVKRIPSTGSLKSLQMPFRRLRMAASREEAEDRVVDFVIGLERLLANDTESLEPTFRFRLRGAALLPNSFGDPRARIKLMTDLYRLRSSVVHGNVKSEDLDRLLPQAQSVFRAIFVWYLYHADILGSAEKVVPTLDEVLVSAGSGWAHSSRRKIALKTVKSLARAS